MHRPTTAIVLASLALLGCEEKKNPPPVAPKTGTPAATGTTLPTIPTGTATALKDQAVSAATTAYDAAKKSVDDLVAKAATLPDTVKPTVDAAVTDAKAKLADAQKALNDLKAASADAWRSLSEKASQATAAVRDAVKTAMDKMPK